MRYDIVIVGGGMVGAACAIALQSTGLRIALIDATASFSEDHRLIALNHSSFSLLKNLGVWDQLEPFAAAIKEVHVSNRGHFGATRLSAQEMELSALGFVVPAKEINSALYARLNKTDLLRPEKLISLTNEKNSIFLTLQNRTLEATLLIAADGTHSTVRNLLAIPTDIIDYKQTALVTVTELQRDHDNIAYERFLPNGAIAMLPLTGQRVATIWSGDEANVSQLLKLSDDEFLFELQKQFGYRLGRLQKVQQRFGYPLKFVHAKQYIKDNIILIGNAAHTVHPIAAQGLNLALYEIAVLAEHLRTQSSENLSLANLSNNLPQQNVSLNLSHRLTQLFSADFFLLHAARQAGMIGLDICGSVKKKFIRSALGRSGRVPTLLT